MVAHSTPTLTPPVSATPKGVPAGSAVSVADVLDSVKARHTGETLDVEDARLLTSLAEGVIGGSKAQRNSAWARTLGPVLKPGTAARLLGISNTALDKRRRAGTVLGVMTDTRRWVYPLAQFRAGVGGVTVVDGLAPVLTQLNAAADGLAAARWLATPNRRLGTSTPWEALADTARRTLVVEAAVAQASAWAGR